MADKQVRIDLQATDHASKTIDKVADEVERLEDAEPEVEVTADTRQAERALDGLADEVDEVARKDAEVLLRAKVDDARGQLKKFQADLKQTGEAAEDTRRKVDDIGGAQGPRLAGNTVADLTGPLGDASGAASDLGGVFDGLGDLAEGALTRMGGNAAAMAGSVSAGLGLAGLAVAGLAAGWTYFSGKAKKAAEDAKKVAEAQREIADALKEGDVQTAGEKFRDAYDPAVKVAEKLGVSVEAATKFITGQSDELSILNDRWIEARNVVDQATTADVRAAQQGHNARLSAAQDFLAQYDAVMKARDGYAANNTAMSEADERLARIQGAMGDATSAADRHADAMDRVKRRTDQTKDAMDRLRGSLNMERTLVRFAADFKAAHDKVVAGTALTADEILSLKEDVLDVAEFAKVTPVEVSSLLERIDNGDYLGVKTDVEAKSAANPAGVATALETPSTEALRNWINTIQFRINAMGGRVYVPGGGFVQPDTRSAGGGGTVNVTQYVPRGYRGDLLADAAAAARRSGGLYHRARR